MGCLLHEQAHGHLPTGGWTDIWVGDPDRGTGKTQPGGWVFNILPYIEQQALYARPSDGNPNEITNRQLAGAGAMLQTPLSAMNCPSRRLAMLLPFLLDSQWWPKNAEHVDSFAATDYAANSGDTIVFPTGGPSSLTDGNKADWWSPYDAAMADKATGVIYLRSEVSISQIRDGTSNTYLLGEKYLNPDHYISGEDAADNSTMLQGYDLDTNRFAHAPPRQDRAGTTDYYLFGSAHAGGCNMAFCDGSVRTISYMIDGETHRRLGNRNDGQPVDAGMF